MGRQYNYIDWERDKTFSPSIGQEVDIEIFLDLRDCGPPAYYSEHEGIMQVGEPYDHDYKTGKKLYTTLRKNENGHWTYCGNCFLGETEDKTSQGYSVMARYLSRLVR